MGSGYLFPEFSFKFLYQTQDGAAVFLNWPGGTPFMDVNCRVK